MATHWSSQNVVAEHKSIPATAMSVDNSGSMALLAGRRFLGLVKLDEPNKIVRESTRGQNTTNKFDVKVVEWNPTSELNNYIALAAGNDCEVYSVGEGGRLATESLLQAHVRAISDINWHRSDAHLLATASVESYLYLWDIREPRRPMSTLPATSGASQVKWNRQNSHLLASGHETDMRIWDSRKPDHPLLFLPARASKVNSIDWSPHNASHIVSSAQDSTVRFFNILNARHPVSFIRSEHPVWRAKYTPFGHGVVTIVVPLLRGGDNSLLLWAADEPSAPVHCFMGHTDVVTNFDWRNNEPQGANEDCQLVSWGRDRCLRVWRLDQNMQSLCGQSVDFGVSSDEATSLDGGSSMTGAEMSDEATLPHSSGNPLNPGTQDSFITSQSSPLVAATASLDLLMSSHDANPGTDGGISTASSSIKAEPLISQFLEPRITGGLEDEGVGVSGASFGSTSTLVSGGSCRTSVTGGGGGGRSSMVQTPTLSSSVPQESGFGLTTTSVTSSSVVALLDKKMSLSDELAVLRNTAWKNEAIHDIEVMAESSKRQVSVLAGAGFNRVGVVISLHAGYPNSQPLQLSLKPPTTFDRFVKLEIMNVLNAVADEYSQREENCLLPLVKTLLDTLALQLTTEGLSQHEGSLPALGGNPSGVEEPTEREGSLYSYGSFKDHSVPFPRTSGARFCGNGVLVCFTRPVFLSKKNQNKSAVIQTPRSLSALGAYIGTFKPFRAGGGGAGGIKAPKPYSLSLKPYIDTSNFGSMKSSSKKTSSLQKLRHQQQLHKQQQLIQVLQQDQKQQQPQRRKQQSLQMLPPARLGASSEPDRGGSSIQGAHSRTAPVYNGFLAGSLGTTGRRDNDQEEDEGDENGDEDDRDVGPADVSISKYYYHDRSKRRSRYKTNDKVGEVLVYSAERLLPICRTLAQLYRLDARDPMSTCLHNREVAQRNGRQDLVQVWALVAGIAKLRPNTMPSDSALGPGLDAPWALHPLVRPTITKLIRHFTQLGDVQTAALLSCVFGTPYQQLQQDLLTPKPVVQQVQHQHHQQQQQHHTSRRSHHQSSHQHKILDRLLRRTGGSPYNTIHGLNMKGEAAHDPCPQVNRHNRSNSEGSLAEASRPAHDLSLVASLTDAPPSPSKAQLTRFLPSSRCQQYEEIRRAYCNILYSWQLLDQRTEVLQYCSSTGGGAKEAGFLSECSYCKQLLRSHFCNHCKKPAITCSICQLPVRGHSVFCLWCGHGGHTTHLLSWFTNNDHCPTGCGCECISYFNQL